MTSQEERSQWGRSMLAKRGGYAVQRLYREQSRVGDQHPAHKAAKVSAKVRKERNERREKEKHPNGLLIQKARHKMLPIW